MSQFWHANWAEDGFKPARLQNWEVPRWHAQWPDRHCATTKFEAHKNGRLFASTKRIGSPWGNFKGTWELPLKITRQTAEELSKSTEYKKGFWKAHKAKHEKICHHGKCVRKKGKASDEEDEKETAKVEDQEATVKEEKLISDSEVNDEVKQLCEYKKGFVL